MRVRRVVTLASLLFCLFVSNQPAEAQTRVAWIPQFADGFDGQSIWQTTLLIDGRTFGADRAVVRVFDSHGRFLNGFGLGNFLFFNVFGQPIFAGPFTPLRFFNFRELLARPLRTGFLLVESPGVVNVTALIRRFSISGHLLSELIVSPFDPFHRARLFSQDIEARELAFALTNTDSLKRAFGRFDFFPLGSFDPLFSFPFEIGPLSQFSRFFFEMFPDVVAGGLRGTIRITSDRPLSLLALRLNGEQMHQVSFVIEE